MAPSPLWLAYGRVLADSTLDPSVRREVLAGLTTMRALERALAAAPAGEDGAVDIDALRTGRELLDVALGAVRMLDADTRGRTALTQLVREVSATLSRPGSTASTALLDALFAYGDALLQTSLSLAAQVYQAGLSYVDEAAHGAAALPWLVRGAQGDALAPDRTDAPNLRRLARLARRHRSDEHRLLASLYRGMHVLNRGNLPAAARMLRRVVDAAHRRELRHVEGRARHLLGCLYGRQRRYVDAVHLFHEAVGIVEPDFRENVLMNLVEGLMDIGQHDVAREACLFLADRARAAWVRDGSRITLLELAGRAGDAAEVRRRFAELEPMDLTPETAIWMRAEAATAFRAIGDRAAARQQAELCVQIAERFGFQQRLIEMEAFLRALDAAPAPAPSRDAVVPDVLGDSDRASLSRLRGDVKRWRAQPGAVADVVAGRR